MTYPDFLRLGSESWRKGGISETLSDSFHTSRSSAREDLFPLLLASMNDRTGFEHSSIDLSLRLGLAAEDHLALNGIRPSSTEGKRLIKAFEERRGNPDPQPTPYEEDEPVETDTKGSGQPSLMDF